MKISLRSSPVHAFGMFASKITITFLFFNLPSLLSQSLLPTNYSSPEDCPASTFFDPIRLQCLDCPMGTVSAVNHLQCKCPSGSAGVTGHCRQCAEGEKVSSDGSACVTCQTVRSTNGSTSEDNHCPSCPTNYYRRIELSKDGRIIRESCSPCENGYKVSSTGYWCQPCDDNEAQTCSCKSDGCQQNGTVEMEKYKIYNDDGTYYLSRHLMENLQEASEGCTKNVRRMCQYLANMCVLQNYRRSSTSACTLYDQIKQKQQNDRGYDAIPPLFYDNTESWIEFSRESAIQAKFTFDSTQPNSYLKIVSLQYSLNGTFLGLLPLLDTIFPLATPFPRFGHKIYSEFHFITKSFQYKELHPIFHELYLKYENELGVNQLYPIPIVNENIRSSDKFVNRDGDDKWSKWILTRRMYTVDTITRTAPTNSSITYPMRYLSKLEVYVTLQEEENGRIMPPFVKIRYDDLKGKQEDSVMVVLRIEYSADPTRLARHVEIVMAVLCSLSLISAAIKAYSWCKREGKLLGNVMTISQFVIFECEMLADIFFGLIIVLTIGLTFGYKMQKIPYFIVLNDQQEWMLLPYIIACVILKIISAMYRNFIMIKTQTLFIDWERPKVTQRIEYQIDRTDMKDADNSDGDFQTNVWRTYMVANEWNELRYYRQTNLSFQLIAMFLLLEGLQLKNLAIIRPGLSLESEGTDQTQTRLSIFAISSVLYGLLGAIQWLIRVLLIERFFLSPFRNIVDLCSVANISILALTHSLYGFYIHGKSVHGYADTSMADMNMCLHKEKNNLCGQRGLESGTDLQTFTVNLPQSVREQIDETAASLQRGIQRCAPDNTDALTAKMANIAKANNECSRMLVNFINHGNSRADYTVRDLTFMEALLDIEFTDTTMFGSFNRDKSEMAFSKVFTYGNEWVHFTLELTMFCFTNMFTKNCALAAFLTYVLSKSFCQICRSLQITMLIRKSYIDERFLV